MAKANFPAALKVTLAHEGGWADHPKDPGGATMKGVTLKTFRSYFPGATKTQLRNITEAQLQRIYRDGYWDKVNGDTLHPGVDLATFDYGVNSGPGAARKSLLAVVGGSDVQTVKRLCARRLSIYRGFRHWSTFGKGWTRRITQIEAKGVAWALAAQNDSHVVKDQLADEQTAAEATARKQVGTAGGTGAGGVAVSPEAAEQLAGWVLGGFVVIVAAVVAFLVWRAVVNKRRAAAYAEEGAAL